MSVALHDLLMGFFIEVYGSINPLQCCQILVLVAPIGTSGETSPLLQVLQKEFNSFWASILGFVATHRYEAGLL